MTVTDIEPIVSRYPAGRRDALIPLAPGGPGVARLPLARGRRPDRRAPAAAGQQGLRRGDLLQPVPLPAPGALPRPGLPRDGLPRQGIAQGALDAIQRTLNIKPGQTTRDGAVQPGGGRVHGRVRPRPGHRGQRRVPRGRHLGEGDERSCARCGRRRRRNDRRPTPRGPGVQGVLRRVLARAGPALSPAGGLPCKRPALPPERCVPDEARPSGTPACAATPSPAR